MLGISLPSLAKAKTLQGNATDAAGLDDLFGQCAANADNSVSPLSPFAAFAPYGFSRYAPPIPPPGPTAFTVFNGGITFVLNFTDADGPIVNFKNDIAASGAGGSATRMASGSTAPYRGASAWRRRQDRPG